MSPQTNNFGFIPDSVSNPVPQNQSNSDNLGFVPQPDPVSNLASNIGKGILGAGQGALNLTNQAETALASPLATPVQLLAKAFGQPDPYANGIPNLGGNSIPIAPATPAGFLVKAGQVGQVASLAVGGPEMGAVKLLAQGAGLGFSNGLASGETDEGQLVKDGIYGSLWNIGLGLAGKFLGHVGLSEIDKTGVSGQVREAIQGNPALKLPPMGLSLVNDYIKAAQEAGSKIYGNSPDKLITNAGTNEINTFLEKVVPDIGQAVGTARKAAGNLPITSVDTNGQVLAQGQAAGQAAFDDIHNVVNEMTGHQFGTIAKSGFEGGSTPIVTQMPGRQIEISNADTEKLKTLYGQLDLLQSKPTVGVASDILKNLDGMIDWNTAATGHTSPVDGAIQYARGAVNRLIAPASPELSVANAAYSQAMDLKGQIATEAGNNLQNANLFMRRAVSGDMGARVEPIFKQLDAATKPYMPANTPGLIQHAILADWSKSMFGGDTTKTLLQRAVRNQNSDVDMVTASLGYARNFAKVILNRTLGFLKPDAAEYARAIASGKEYSPHAFDRLLNMSILSDNSPILKQTIQGLHNVGLTPTNEVEAAKSILRAWTIQKLTQPQNSQTNFTPAMPSAILPSGPQQPVVAQQQGQPVAMGQTRSLAQPAAVAINNTSPATSGQQYSSQARKLTDFGMNMNTGTRGLSLS